MQVKKILKIIIIIIMCDFSLFAFSFKDLELSVSKRNNQNIGHIDIVDKNTDIYFDPDLVDVVNHRLYFALTTLSKEMFQKSKYLHFDIDNIHTLLDNESVISIAKTVFLFKNIKADYFDLDKITDLDYCKIAFNDDKRKKESAHEIISYKKYFIKTISAKVNFSTFDFLKNNGKGLSRNKALFLASLSNIDRLPDFINTSHSSEKDISIGSYGNRTINLYYNVGNDYVLHISFKIVSFKKEKIYDSFMLRPLNIWGNILSKIESSQRLGTRDSIQNISDYIQKNL